MQVNTKEMTGKQHLMKKPSIKLRRKTISMVSVFKPTQLSNRLCICCCNFVYICIMSIFN